MRIHIIGIAGTKTAPLAKILVEQGHKVTGSDQTKIFPPISTILENAGITINNTVIDNTIDLVIVGNVYLYFENTRAEFEKVKQLGIPYISYTEYIVKNLAKSNSILVAGSYGKTTVASLLSYIFLSLELDPSYMFGGDPIGDFSSTRFSKSKWSIIEADENHNGLDSQTTFLYYPVNYLILTSAQWEHKDSFDSAEDNLAAYRQLVEKVPTDGLIIYNGLDPEIQKIITFSHAKTIDYQTDNNFETKLIGKYNQENISAAFTLCHELHLNENQILEAIKNFPGIKRRLELISQNNNILIFDDFAQSAVRVKTSLEALKYSYPDKRIRVYFEPRASFLQNKKSLIGFSQLTPLFYDFVLSKIQFSGKLDKSIRTTAADWQKEIGSKLKYLPLDKELTNYFIQSLEPDDILVHFSSGGLDGLNTLYSIISHLDSKTL
jgi:UDP-N-acetylmuramate: L-alanyl-gamma-D-glutamyl-meso-diaminopimelate ligase